MILINLFRIIIFIIILEKNYMYTKSKITTQFIYRLQLYLLFYLLISIIICIIYKFLVTLMRRIVCVFVPNICDTKILNAV